MEFPEQRQKIKEAGQGKVRTRPAVPYADVNINTSMRNCFLRIRQNTLEYFRFY